MGRSFTGHCIETAVLLLLPVVFGGGVFIKLLPTSASGIQVTFAATSAFKFYFTILIFNVP
jgi:hypothetical protein